MKPYSKEAEYWSDKHVIRFLRCGLFMFVVWIVVAYLPLPYNFYLWMGSLILISPFLFYSFFKIALKMLREGI